MSKKLMIALIAACPFPYPRGTPIRIQRMAEALAKKGHDVHVVTYHLGNDIINQPYKIHRIPNIPFYTKLDPGPTYIKLLLIDTLLSIKLIFLHMRYGFDIIHGHHFEGLLSALPLKIISKKPIIYDAHTLLSTELHHYNFSLPLNLKKFIARKLDINLPKTADHIICVSNSIRDTLAEQIISPEENISVIPNGVKIDLFLRQPARRSPEEENKIILAYAGNFAPYQRLDILLQAFKLICKESPNVYLELYTEDDPTLAQRMISEYGLNSSVRIIKTPFSDLPERLSKTDILLNPRMDGAGQPIKLLNYMAAGKPIVTFEGSSHGLTHNETAWVIQEDSATAFANGIINLIQDVEHRQMLGDNARKYVEDNHIWDVNADILTEVYRNLLSI